MLLLATAAALLGAALTLLLHRPAPPRSGESDDAPAAWLRREPTPATASAFNPGPSSAQRGPVQRPELNPSPVTDGGQLLSAEDPFLPPCNPIIEH